MYTDEKNLVCRYETGAGIYKLIVHVRRKKRKILLFSPQIIKDFPIIAGYTGFKECSRNKAAPKLSYTYSHLPPGFMQCHCVTAAGSEKATEDFYNEYSK